MLCYSIRPVDRKGKIGYWLGTDSTWPKERSMEDLPDIYCDTMSMAQTAYGVAFTFSLSPSMPVPGQATPEPQAVVRMSLEHAKVFAMVVRKNLKQYELEHLGDPIRIPAEVLRQLNLSEESDW